MSQSVLSKLSNKLSNRPQEFHPQAAELNNLSWQLTVVSRRGLEPPASAVAGLERSATEHAMSLEISGVIGRDL
jgi:hypothetical protein